MRSPTSQLAVCFSALSGSTTSLKEQDTSFDLASLPQTDSQKHQRTSLLGSQADEVHKLNSPHPTLENSFKLSVNYYTSEDQKPTEGVRAPERGNHSRLGLKL